MTGDVYKHITASAQRRLSIEWANAKDGAFLATFCKGAGNQLRATRDRVQSYRMKLGDSSLESPVSRLSLSVNATS